MDHYLTTTELELLVTALTRVLDPRTHIVEVDCTLLRNKLNRILRDRKGEV